jgi:outer membrane protein insertion porin family
LIGRCFDNQQLDELGGGVRDVLQSLGYLRAAVPEPSIAASDTSRHPQPVSVNVEVDEGARYKVREIEVIGSTAISQEQFIALEQIQLEDFFDRNKMRETAEAVRKLYAANGYLNASITPEVQIFGPRAVCVRFKVVEGPQSP